MNQLRFWRLTTLLSITALIGLSVVWNGWLSPIQQVPRIFEISVLVVPLLLFLRGVLNERRQVFLLVSLLSLPYVLTGVWYVYSPLERGYGVLMVLFGSLLFASGFFYLKTLGKLEKGE